MNKKYLQTLRNDYTCFKNTNKYTKKQTKNILETKCLLQFSQFYKNFLNIYKILKNTHK